MSISVRSCAAPVALAVAGLCASAAHADVVFQNTFNNGFFTPFSSANAATAKYGDSGWLSGGSSSGMTLTSITLGFAAYDSLTAGTTDIKFTFNDGDPSGLVFGPGTTLYSTTITNVALPATGAGTGSFFSLTIPLPNVLTSGGFDNIGWSIGLSNYNYAGSFGFQCSTALGQSVGFYTNNASFYNGSSWSLFSFSSNTNTGVANFVATVTNNVPAPGSLALLGLGMGAAARRRRR